MKCVASISVKPQQTNVRQTETLIDKTRKELLKQLEEENLYVIDCEEVQKEMARSENGEVRKRKRENNEKKKELEKKTKKESKMKYVGETGRS